ncbi:protein-glutamate methylesterase/protein-glutamine glutaminase [Desulfuromonas acetoxidans]|uniref:Protein-glutamate methylesterase/protein-glutamine glutaminase n=1 Tax=Desulfuromonas acetoxidans (strain DSM 684 / 11070) TaxID=281689 RepID=Q1JWP8_DESA6|nr:chemotaxis response regulator protein-glutamate methylesterase [Desulfuromonas acetoxidans]EAT14631.1 response regulator receiver modulated CheB methylesterase [Desulfuromonas acetoxidans DSM 684]
MAKVKVLIVDDSAVVRQALQAVLESDPHIEVMATASDPFVAAERMKKQIPDVITLDVEMPRMDGLTFLQKIMSQHPIPVVICSSLAEKGSETLLKAMEFGAVDIIQKPLLGTKTFIEESRVLICDAIKAAAKTSGSLQPIRQRKVEPKHTADVVLSRASSKAMVQTTEKIIAVGASTGGTEALRVFLEQFPMDAPGIVVVQHMPENFTRGFAQRLDTLCQMSVKEAENGDSVVRGHVLIAPGNRHMLLKRSGARYYVELKDGPLVSRHRPSVDVLFRSTARYAGKNAIGVILTGMGDDGAKGMKEMKEAGAVTFAQNEASCVVFGMPNEAIKLGGVDKVLALSQIPRNVLDLC